LVPSSRLCNQESGPPENRGNLRSSWNQVTAILQRHGHNVVAVQLPLTSPPDDVA